jgi:DNA polymerase-3 subunit epsilon
VTWADGPLLGFDLETTGVDPLTALPVSFGLISFDHGELVKSRQGLIDPGVPIPPEATAIHHITDAMVSDEKHAGNLERSVVGIAGELLAASFAGTPVVGMNLRYDLSLIDARLLALTGEGLRAMGWNGYVIDISVIDRKLDKFRKGSRTLLALCTQYGVDPGESHEAKDDATASVRIALALEAKYPAEVGGVELEMLHVQQVAWRREWARDFSEYRVKDGKEPLAEDEGDWPLIGDKGVSL